MKAGKNLLNSVPELKDSLFVTFLVSLRQVTHRQIGHIGSQIHPTKDKWCQMTGDTILPKFKEQTRG